MKRIIGRSIIEDFSTYGDYKVNPVNFDLIDPNAVHFRYRWAVDMIQHLRNQRHRTDTRTGYRVSRWHTRGDDRSHADRSGRRGKQLATYGYRRIVSELRDCM